jgi:sialate O-acetylesterase
MIRRNMVLQRGAAAPIWGKAEPGLRVRVEFKGQCKEALVDDQGSWMIRLDPMEASSENADMTISYVKESAGGLSLPEPLVLDSVLVGEVWLCSGQSNMELGVAAMQDAVNDLDDSYYPEIRLYMIAKVGHPLPQERSNGVWYECDRENLTWGGWNGFSAVAFTFARKLHAELGVPVGVIQAAFGGAPIEAFVSRKGIMAGQDGVFARAARALAKGDADYAKALAADPGAEHPFGGFVSEDRYLKPSSAFNAMIHPIAPYAVAGFLWYQGETNIGDGMDYAEKQLALARDWREAFGLGDLPFYLALLAPWGGYGGAEQLPLFWEAQMAAASGPGMGYVNTIDVGDAGDIHPRRKKEVGERFALLALERAYGLTAYEGDCPVPSEAGVENGGVTLSYANSAGSLSTSDGAALRGFEIAGADGHFVKAAATIEGSRVTLRAESVPEPRFVRYAWANVPDANLAGGTGLPAAPFRMKLD